MITKMPPLRQLAMRIGRRHPLYAVAVTAFERFPEHRDRIPVAVADWVRWANLHDHDAMTIDRAGITAMLESGTRGSRWSRLRGLSCVCTVLIEQGVLEEDPTVDLTLPPFRKLLSRRLTPSELALVVSNVVRDLDHPSRALTAARDLVALGLLALGDLTPEGLLACRWGDIDEVDGQILLRGQPLPDGVGTAVRLYRRLLMQARICPCPGDALVAGTSPDALAPYRGARRPEVLPLRYQALRVALIRRMRREGLAVVAGDGGHVHSWASLSWLTGAGVIEPRLPIALQLCLTERIPCS